ncbi:MAG: hypothetical protein A2W22_02540 [Candidatus Levybacteria bacterium RBG_16_35_11]|nr:MAG: hypothetical protein A2W22_02540 [Candidatus Levybacteria bacterium RBG_16_35_11]
MGASVRFITLKLFIFFVCVYLLSTSPINIFDTDASMARYYLTRSIVERFDLSIPADFGIKGIDGRDYSWYGLGQSVLAIPFYLLGKYLSDPANAVSIMPQIFGAAAAVLVFLFCIVLGYSRRTSLYVALLYGLGTFAWPLAKQPFDHTIETFFILLSIYFIYLYVTDKKFLHLLFSAFSFGFAFITRQTSMLVIMPLFVLVIVHYLKRHDFKTTACLITRDLALFSLAFLPFIGLSLWYNYYRFGSIFETGYQLIAVRTGIDFFSGTPFLTGLSGFLISPGKGFFYYSPVAILFFFGIKSFFKRHLELAICFILIALSYLFFLSKNLYWHGDWAWGPRYLLAITPFFIIPVAEIFESDIWKKNVSLRAFAYFVIAVSFVIQIAAVSVCFQKYFFYLIHEKDVKFTVVYGAGVQAIVEPPSETHFDWHKSPILTHFKFIYELASKMKDYKYSKLPENATDAENYKANPRMNLIDFWWIHNYYVNGSYSEFFAAFLLLIVSIYYASTVWKTVT